MAMTTKDLNETLLQLPKADLLKTVISLVNCYSLEFYQDYSLKWAGKEQQISVALKDPHDVLAIGKELPEFKNNWYFSPESITRRLRELIAAGELQLLRTRLCIDVHSLLSLESYCLARSKKVMTMSVALGLVDVIQFQVWGESECFGCQVMERVPFELFITHFSEVLKTNVHGASIQFSDLDMPKTEEEKKRIAKWSYNVDYDDNDSSL
ncbi:hypothetical protein KP509_24G049200 [Ceratopteris richardii]|uniref:Uncharacterized protein n=1 Tax=Ceratopteris richardii TaxID=49495 RepID=A0A8T2RUI4_CERRI|nr:hypothetical protein KP509_24G049200 [Ceratopteris richardii]